MSGIEILGATLSILAVTIKLLEDIQHLQHYRDNPRTGIKKQVSLFQASIKEYGYVVTLLLFSVFSDARSVMDRVERYVLQANDENVVAFMESYTSSFNSIGVAGAIIAQVAISALSLTGLEDSHWTAAAFFVASLVTGCLSVFFSCTINPIFHGLHSAESIKDFFAKPTRSANERQFKSGLARVREFPRNEDMKRLMGIIEGDRWKVASAYSSIMLVVPMTLLNIALNAFLTGLGIYLGKLYTARFIPSYGGGSVGILVFYLVTAFFGIMMFYMAQSLKYIESVPLKKWRRVIEDYSKQEAQIRQHQKEVTLKEDQEPGQPLSRIPFLQSVHSRSGSRNRISYTTPDDTAHHTSNEEQNSQQTVENSVRKDEQAPLVAEIPLVAGPADTVAQPQLDLVNVKKVLEELIQAQEHTLAINRRLLEVFNASESTC